MTDFQYYNQMNIPPEPPCRECMPESNCNEYPPKPPCHECQPEPDCQRHPPENCRYLYDVNMEMVTLKIQPEYLKLVHELNEHLSHHYEFYFAGIQLYQINLNAYIMILRYYDTEDVLRIQDEINRYVSYRYKELGRGIRRTRVLDFAGASRIQC